LRRMWMIVVVVLVPVIPGPALAMVTVMAMIVQRCSRGKCLHLNLPVGGRLCVKFPAV
jgi:hypothetical protein